MVQPEPHTNPKFNVCIRIFIWLKRACLLISFPYCFLCLHCFYTSQCLLFLLIFRRSDSVGSIRNLPGISIVLDPFGRFHTQPISESHIGRLKRQPIGDSFALMEKHVFKLCVASSAAQIWSPSVYLPLRKRKIELDDRIE